MLDKDLAELYGVETRALVQQVKRNIDRFPDDFMFQLSVEETAALTSQIVISKGRGGRRTPRDGSPSSSARPPRSSGSTTSSYATSSRHCDN
jgi:hypothetical protein